MEHAVQAIAGLSALPYEALAMRHQHAPLAHWWGRDPDFGDESGRK
jgi:hypothetical protein